MEISINKVEMLKNKICVQKIKIKVYDFMIRYI